MYCEIGGTQGPLGYVSALGATRLVHGLILVAPSCLRSHNARYIMLKSLINSSGAVGAVLAIGSSGTASFCNSFAIVSNCQVSGCLRSYEAPGKLLYWYHILAVIDYYPVICVEVLNIISPIPNFKTNQGVLNFQLWRWKKLWDLCTIALLMGRTELEYVL